MTDSGVRFSAKSRDSDEIHFSDSKTGTDGELRHDITMRAPWQLYYCRALRRTSITEHAPNVTANYSQKARSSRVAARANAQIRRCVLFKILTARCY